MGTSGTSADSVRSGASRNGRRAAAVCTGTFMLCLFASAPAWAGLSPDPLPTTIPVPTVTAVPTPGPVHDLVQKVEQTVGVNDPLPSSTATTQHKVRHHLRTAAGQSTTPTTRQTRSTAIRHTATAPSRHLGSLPVPPAVLSGFGAGSFGMSGPAEAVRAPVTAPVVVAPMAVRQPTSDRTLSVVLGGPGGLHALRIVLLAVATSIATGIAAAHIKTAQQALSPA